MDRIVEAGVRGGLAGAAATVPMSAVMLAAERLGLMGEHPPELITEQALDAAGIQPERKSGEALATAAHFGFGAMAGALFGIARESMDLPLPAVAQGVGYGLLVYTVSYFGWLPAADVMPRPDHDRPGRQPSMLAAHVVYGAALGALLARRHRERPARRHLAESDRIPTPEGAESSEPPVRA
jgi:hypothetical protein